jgi:3-methyl-2-oxobutanoate hydroxymethyltransferase
VSAGIPVMGHVGLTPQSVHEFGGFRVQGRDEDTAERLRQDALALQDAGAYALVLEGIPAALARQVSESLAIPTIGIGAGVGCDGQVLVMQDLLGLDDRFKPRFVKRYLELAGTVRDAFAQFARDVRERRFPADEHSFSDEEPVKPAKVLPAGYGPT